MTDDETYLSRAIRRAFLSSVPITYPYLFTLDRIHRHLRPRTYFEVGVCKGMSLGLALPGTLAVGVDPEPQICHPLRRRTRLFRQTSDSFFTTQDVREVFGGRSIDLAFIDGMHNFEFALRDLMHVERYSHPDTVVLVHDCYPIDKETSSRHRSTQYWSGDVWKLFPCLEKWRPDLKCAAIDAGPTGLGIITGLDARSRQLEDHYAECVDEFRELPYEYLEEHGKDDVLHRVPNDWASILPLLPARPFRSIPSDYLCAVRAASAWTSKVRGHSNGTQALAHSFAD